MANNYDYDPLLVQAQRGMCHGQRLRRRPRTRASFEPPPSPPHSPLPPTYPPAPGAVFIVHPEKDTPRGAKPADVLDTLSHVPNISILPYAGGIPARDTHLPKRQIHPPDRSGSRIMGWHILHHGPWSRCEAAVDSWTSGIHARNRLELGQRAAAFRALENRPDGSADAGRGNAHAPIGPIAINAVRVATGAALVDGVADWAGIASSPKSVI